MVAESSFVCDYHLSLARALSLCVTDWDFGVLANGVLSVIVRFNFERFCWNSLARIFLIVKESHPALFGVV